MKMLEPLAQIDWLATELLSMSFAGGSPAKTSALQEKEQGLRENAADCGGSSIGSSKKSGRRGSSLKTYQPFDITDWATSCGPSLRSGTMRNGTVYPLPPLAPLTAGTESGLWPTPRAQDSKHAAATEWELTTDHAGTVGSLRVQVVKRMWPTPTAVWRPMEGNVRILREKVLAGEMSEQEATAMLGKSPFEAQGTIPQMWPTPAARDYRGANGYETTLDKIEQGRRAHLGQLPNAVQVVEGKAIRGTLNPMWVEWLMGFPLEWTALKPSEMPSSRKSRKSSEKE